MIKFIMNKIKEYSHNALFLLWIIVFVGAYNIMMIRSALSTTNQIMKYNNKTNIVALTSDEKIIILNSEYSPVAILDDTISNKIADAAISRLQLPK